MQTIGSAGGLEKLKHSMDPRQPGSAFLCPRYEPGALEIDTAGIEPIGSRRLAEFAKG
jgi:hypothetical protein